MGKSYPRLFSLVAIVCVAVPGFASIKAVLILALWSYLLLQSRFRLRSMVWLLSVLLNLVAWCEVALFHDVAQGDMVNHLSRLVLFFLILGIGVFTAESGSFAEVNLDRLIVAIAALSAGLKVLVIALILSGSYSLDAIQKAFGFETVTDAIGYGIQRLQFPSDIILIFLVACYVGGRNKLVDVLFLLGVTVSVFLSFSRYLFVAYLVCLVLRAFQLRRVDTVSRSGIVFAALLILFFSVTLLTRFAGQGSSASDSIRTEQIQQLTNVIAQHRIFGTGIGSSVSGYLRSQIMPFSYEVEWYALTMQLGFLGLLWFVGNLASPLVISLKSRNGKLFSLVVFSLWVVGGFTNPLVTSLGSAFGLCILMLRLVPRSVSLPTELAI